MNSMKDLLLLLARNWVEDAERCESEYAMGSMDSQAEAKRQLKESELRFIEALDAAFKAFKAFGSGNE